jgi:proton-coupled amino acid transporter
LAPPTTFLTFNAPYIFLTLNTQVQFLYSLAILLSVPLQLFPAVRIMENGIFTKRSGKADTRIKWLKNLFRCAIVVLCAAISWAGAKDLDKFVAFIGSFAW